MSQVCEQGLHHQCQGHDAIGGCRCPNPVHAVAPADELRAAVRLLRNPYNCLPGKDLLADLLDAVADDMDEHSAVEGSASKAVHPRTILGLGAPRAHWTAALAVARAQPGIESEMARGAADGSGGGAA
jgi:hypothetical protein